MTFLIFVLISQQQHFSHQYSCNSFFWTTFLLTLKDAVLSVICQNQMLCYLIMAFFFFTEATGRKGIKIMLSDCLFNLFS
jgi:hypothetical protein